MEVINEICFRAVLTAKYPLSYTHIVNKNG